MGDGLANELEGGGHWRNGRTSRATGQRKGGSAADPVLTAGLPVCSNLRASVPARLNTGAKIGRTEVFYGAFNDSNDTDIRMGLWSRFYGRFWSEWFILIVVTAALAFAGNLLAAIRHPAVARHEGMSAFIVVAAFAAMSLHRRRIMRLLRERQIDRRVLGEMASVVFSLTMIAFIGTIVR